MTDNFTNKQIADRYNATKAIFNAMVTGRELSFLNSAEFEIAEFHTAITKIRQMIERKNLPLQVIDRWIEFGKHGKRCKAYKIIRKPV